MFNRGFREARRNVGKVLRFLEKVGYVLCILFYLAIYSEF